MRVQRVGLGDAAIWVWAFGYFAAYAPYSAGLVVSAIAVLWAPGAWASWQAMRGAPAAPVT